MGSLFSKPKIPAPPPIKPPTPLPDEDALKRNKRIEAAKRGGGRESTILSDDSYGL